jgi:hypothetical protein
MSLNDPNLRRVLLAARGNQPDIRTTARNQRNPDHFAVLPSLTPQRINLSSQSSADLANRARSQFWRSHNVEVIALPDRASLGPFLMRIRYESFGVRPGDLWRAGAERCARISPWRADRQRVAAAVLNDAVTTLRNDFNVTDRSEIVEIGLFLLKHDATTIELVFRGGAGRAPTPGAREFSVDPDQPTGMAGRVFVSGDITRVARNDPIFDYGMPKTPVQSSASPFAGIVSAPLIDWKAQGVPLGVIYVTVSSTRGTLFGLPPRIILGSSQRTLFDLGAWLQSLGLDLLSAMA